MDSIFQFASSLVLDLKWGGGKKMFKKKETILSSDKECHEHQCETGEAVAAFRLEVRSQGEGQGHCRSVEPLECSADILHWRRWVVPKPQNGSFVENPWDLMRNLNCKMVPGEDVVKGNYLKQAVVRKYDVTACVELWVEEIISMRYSTN